MGQVKNWVASKVLGTTEAAAAPCEGTPYYQYLCGSDGYKYRRSCYYDRCDRRTYCGPLQWVGYC